MAKPKRIVKLSDLTEPQRRLIEALIRADKTKARPGAAGQDSAR